MNLSSDLLQKIQEYNSSTSILKGSYTEYAVELLQAFQDEYDGYPDQGKNENGEFIGRAVHVIGFLNLKSELRDCAKTIGRLALYENAEELLRGDPTSSYILKYFL